MKKHHIVEMKQQEHVMNERNIMMDTQSDFIVRLIWILNFSFFKIMIISIFVVVFSFNLDYIKRLKIENIYIC